MSSSAQDTLRLPFLFQEIFPFPLSPEQGVQPVCQASFHLPPPCPLSTLLAPDLCPQTASPVLCPPVSGWDRPVGGIGR